MKLYRFKQPEINILLQRLRNIRIMASQVNNYRPHAKDYKEKRQKTGLAIQLIGKTGKTAQNRLKDHHSPPFQLANQKFGYLYKNEHKTFTPE